VKSFPLDTVGLPQLPVGASRILSAAIAVGVIAVVVLAVWLVIRSIKKM